jgi:leucine dehydrogenase
MSVFSNPAFDRHQRVVFANDSASGLRAIIAVHDTRLGPGVGGCRMYPYANEAEALHDVLRLSRGMTYKSALAGLPFGGGKSVIMGDPRSDKSKQLLLAMGEFVESLGGLYVATEDSGTSVEDMRTMAARTSHVSGVQEDTEHGGDPSPSTAWGVFLGIRTAVQHRLGGDSLTGLRVAIQGLGNVGFHLAGLLVDAGAEVFGADVSSQNLQRACEQRGVVPVATTDILSLEADVFAPCAMGAVLDSEVVDQLRVGIVAGAANNQLAADHQADQLIDRGILYCPDFLINSGGIIDVHYQRMGGNRDELREHIARIEGNLREILFRSDRSGRSPHWIAEELAEEFLATGQDRVRLAAF